MKSVLLFASFLLLGWTAQANGPVLASPSVDVGGQAHFCFEVGGVKMCIDVVVDLQDVPAFESARIKGFQDGTDLILNGFGKNLEGHSFQVTKQEKLKIDGKENLLMPGKFVVTRGTASLKLGEEGGDRSRK